MGLTLIQKITAAVTRLVTFVFTGSILLVTEPVFPSAFLAPNHRWRGLVTPAKRGKGAMRPVDSDVVSSIQRHAAMTWAQRLKRVFNIDIEVCGRCGGSVRVIACIEDQEVIDRILAHLESKEQNTPTLPHLAPPTRASPETR